MQYKNFISRLSHDSNVYLKVLQQEINLFMIWSCIQIDKPYATVYGIVG
jgi:hypothetical protein